MTAPALAISGFFSSRSFSSRYGSRRARSILCDWQSSIHYAAHGYSISSSCRLDLTTLEKRWSTGVEPTSPPGAVTPWSRGNLLTYTSSMHRCDSLPDVGSVPIIVYVVRDPCQMRTSGFSSPAEPLLSRHRGADRDDALVCVFHHKLWRLERFAIYYLAYLLADTF